MINTFIVTPDRSTSQVLIEVLVQSSPEGMFTLASRGSFQAATTAAQIAGMRAGRPGSFPILN